MERTRVICLAFLGAAGLLGCGSQEPSETRRSLPDRPARPAQAAVGQPLFDETPLANPAADEFVQAAPIETPPAPLVVVPTPPPAMPPALPAPEIYPDAIAPTFEPQPVEVSPQAGYAEACATRAREAEAEGRWGAAALWWMEALSARPAQEHAQALLKAEERINQRITAGLDLAVTDAGGNVGPEATALRTRLFEVLGAASPPLLHVGGPAWQATQAYQAAINISRLDVSTELISAETRTHDYVIYADEPNPEVPRLEALLVLARAELHELRQRGRRRCDACRGRGTWDCPACGASGLRGCSHCHGDGQVTCPTCNGKGERKIPACPACGGDRTRNCPDCHGSGQGTCSTCGGKGQVKVPRCPTCGGAKQVKCSKCRGAGDVSCPVCGGKGQVKTPRCATCGGDGESRCGKCLGSGEVNCPACHGDGIRNKKPCTACNGTGRRNCGNCGGDGKVTCPTCGGKKTGGYKTCSACSGSGRRNCGECGGDGKVTCPTCRGKTTGGYTTCPTCHGSGKGKCRSCGGDGKVTCPVCKGERTGYTEKCPGCNGRGTRACGVCEGRGKVACPQCEGHAHLTCSVCGGTGRRNNVSDWDLRRAEEEVIRLERALQDTPLLVQCESSAPWNYTVETYRKSGKMFSGLLVRGPDAAVVGEPQTIRRTDEYLDELVRDPAPEIGLSADELVLPSDRQMKDQLIVHAANPLADKLLAAVLTDRLRRLSDQADQLARAGKADEARERQVDLVYTLRHTDRPAADRLTQDLLRQLRRPNQPAPAPGQP